MACMIHYHEAVSKTESIIVIICNSGVLGTIFLGGGGQWAINQYAPL